MKALFSTYIHERLTLQAGQVSAALDACRRGLPAGLLRIEAGVEPYLVTVLKGEVDTAHRFGDGGWEAGPWQEWLPALDLLPASLTRIQLPVEGVRIGRLFLGAGALPVESGRLPAQEIAARMHTWSARPEPGLLYARNEGEEFLMVVPGMDFPLLEGLAVTAEAVQSFVASPGDLPLGGQGDYEITYFDGDKQHPNWREYNLRLAFMVLMRLLVLRFGDLAGRALAQRICADLTETSRGRGWEIALEGSSLVHQQVFKDLEAASQVYSFLIRYFINNASEIIGMRLAKGMAAMALEKMNRTQRELLQAYILELQGPEIDRAG